MLATVVLKHVLYVRVWRWFARIDARHPAPRSTSGPTVRHAALPRVNCRHCCNGA